MKIRAQAEVAEFLKDDLGKVTLLLDPGFLLTQARNPPLRD